MTKVIFQTWRILRYFAQEFRDVDAESEREGLIDEHNDSQWQVLHNNGLIMIKIKISLVDSGVIRDRTSKEALEECFTADAGHIGSKA